MKTLLKVLLFVSYITILFALLNLWLLAFEQSETVGDKINIFTKVLFFGIMLYLFANMIRQWFLKKIMEEEYQILVEHYRFEMLVQSMTGFINSLVTDDSCDDLRADIEKFMKEQEQVNKKSNKKNKK
jgi:hypothetical protein